MYWGDQDNSNRMDFYDARFMGFAQASITHPDNSVEVHAYFTTAGWGVYDTSKVNCNTSSPCHNSAWWNPANALHGREQEVDIYDVDGRTLLKQIKTQYQLICPPVGVVGTPGFSAGQLRSDIDHNNPVVVCDIETGQKDTYTFQGASGSLAVPHQTTTYTYDTYGRQTLQVTTSNDGGATGSPTSIVQHSDYIWNDALTAGLNGVTGSYLIDFVADSYTADANNTVRTSCQNTSYDGQGFAVGQQSSLTRGEATTEDTYTACGTSLNGFVASGLIRATSVYDQSGNTVATSDADANAGIGGHVNCTVPSAGSSRFTACTHYDSAFNVLPISSVNALGQTSSTAYTQTASGGFGLWPTASTDVNGQTTTTAYDAVGRPISTILPGEGTGLTTTTTSYTFWCATTGAQIPCAEIDTTRRLDSSTTVTSRAFYDGYGHLIEIRAAGPGGQDVVQYAIYDTSQRRVFLSIQYFVAAYTGGPGAAALSIPDLSQAGTSTTFTNLRSTTLRDALSNATTTSVAVGCGLGNDPACYAISTTVDQLAHQQAMYTDALDRHVYALAYTGTSSSTYAVYATATSVYDLQGHTVKVIQPDGTSATTSTFDEAGRQTQMGDPDLGTEVSTFDPNGNVLQTIDARGSAGTIYIGYDGLNRQIWRNTSNSSAGAYLTESYDSIANGNAGIGRLTGETFSGGGLTGSASSMYDVRGQQTAATLTVGSASYTTQATYNDDGHLLTQTYPDGEVVTSGYTAQGWLLGLTTRAGSTSTTLFNQASYTGPGGAAGNVSSAQLAGGIYTFTAGYDLVMRPTDMKLSLSSGGTTLFESQPGYDAASNVVGVATTVPGGTDSQQFCYDDLNRLVWAGSSGTPSCSGAAITPGTLTSARYTQSFSYDMLNRLTSSPLGSYVYGDGAHLHAATSIGTGYTASYDAAGSMTCRAPTASSTCVGSNPGGAKLSYDNEGHLLTWQNTPTGPTTTASNLYDGSGNRVAQQVTQNGATSTVVYIGNLEEVTTSGSTTSTTTSYYAGKQRIALAVDGVFSYLGSDVLGSATVALDSSGHATASQLYSPYGGMRYSNGTMPGTYGFTGQRADGATGLDYYKARYYDPLAGQFTSADTNGQAGLNRYAYVGGNPESRTDPTGQMYAPPRGGGGSPPPPPPPQHHRYVCNASGCFDNGVRITSNVSLSPCGGCKVRLVHRSDNAGPTPGQIKKGQQQARQIAQDAAGAFTTAGNWIQAIAIALGLVGTVLLAASLWIPALFPWALLAVGAAAGLAMVAVKAFQIANLFSQEASKDLSWFTQANVDSMGRLMALTLAGLTLPSLGGGWALNKIGILVEQSIQKAPETLLRNLVPGLSFSTGAVAFLLTDLIGTGMLGGLLWNDVRQQENVVLT
jgi:RHS repeat-associated protein